MATRLSDNSRMPFGKHAGKYMEDVPASYLLFLWDEGIHAEPERDIHIYIRTRFSALETEASNYIVQHPPAK